MRNPSLLTMLTLMIALLAALPAVADAGKHQRDIDQALVILTSSDNETRGMAMVLANAMQSRGAALTFLLCDSAGDLALQDYQTETPLAPRGMRPEGLLQQLQQGGARVEVCALYLPNRELTEDDLRDGVSVAQPGKVAERMLSPDVRVFSF